MEPYRPLFVLTETEEPPPHELRGLAVLVVVLGVLRLAPALVRGEAISTESAIAFAMLVLGAAVLVRGSRAWRRCLCAVRATQRRVRWR